MNDVHHPDLAALVQAYREASQAELRAEWRATGKRGTEREVKAHQRRDEIDKQLRALGEDDLRVSLVCEHVSGGDIIAHLTGRPLPEGAFRDGLDMALRDLQGHRARIAKRLTGAG